MSTRLRVLLITPTGEIYTKSKVQIMLKTLLLRVGQRRDMESRVKYFIRMRGALKNTPSAFGWELKLFREPRNLQAKKSLYFAALEKRILEAVNFADPLERFYPLERP
jgi:hypothetical protein